MKNLVYVLAILFSGAVVAQEKPSEVKEETKVKTVKYKDVDGVQEKKIKVVKRETSNVQLNAEDAKKVNQERVDATTKVEKKVMMAENSNNFKTLSQVTYYAVGDDNYMFTPSKYGFDMANSKANNEFTKIASAWVTNSNGNYIIKGETQNGIGYFDKDGNFVVEYYDEDSNSIKKMNYNKEKRDIK